MTNQPVPVKLVTLPVLHVPLAIWLHVEAAMKGTFLVEQHVHQDAPTENTLLVVNANNVKLDALLVQAQLNALNASQVNSSTTLSAQHHALRVRSEEITVVVTHAHQVALLVPMGTHVKPALLGTSLIVRAVFRAVLPANS